MLKFPTSELSVCVASVEKLFEEVGHSSISPEIAATAMGYKSLSGPARQRLASLTLFGLIGRDRKNSALKVSDLAVKIIHPVGESKIESLKRAALSPPMFRHLWDSHPAASEKVLASILIQQQLKRETAEMVARCFKNSIQFAGVQTGDKIEAAEENPIEEPDDEFEEAQSLRSSERRTPEFAPLTKPVAANTTERVLATYKIPLGSNEAELIFTGSKLEAEDFDALIDYVEIFKKQFVRKQASTPSPSHVRGWAIEDIRRIFPDDDEEMLLYRQRTGSMATNVEEAAEGI